MKASVKREIEWAGLCLLGALAVVYAYVLSVGLHPPLYAVLTVAVIGAVLVDGYRFFRENAVVTRDDLRLTGVFRPARTVLVRQEGAARPTRHDPRR